MHNLRDMAWLLLIGESRLAAVCAVNGLGVAEKSLVTTLAREAQQRPSTGATALRKVAPASSLGCAEMLLVAVIVDPTARVYSFEAPPVDGQKVWHSHSSNKFDAAPAASLCAGHAQ